MRVCLNEWTNPAGDPARAGQIEELRRWLPEKSAKPAPGNASRILTYENGQATWEGEVISDSEPIPEI